MEITITIGIHNFCSVLNLSWVLCGKYFHIYNPVLSMALFKGWHNYLYQMRTPTLERFKW